MKRKNRLTLGSNGFYDYTTNELELVKKLGQLEDYEDKFKVDLEVLLKAILEGVYVPEDKQKHKAYFSGRSLYVEYKKRYLYYRRKLVSEYGNTWYVEKEKKNVE